MTAKEEKRWLAMCALLALPDEFHRGFHYTCFRDPWRNPEVIKHQLALAYITHRRQEWHAGDISEVVRVSRRARRREITRIWMRRA